ncbi:hypothetical protein ABZ568_00725 [Streptomyces olindensis]|uniref:Uncharacterized protein n=1 Tax=Streptomyces olindensis TaxID=358823 RepID=A0ABV2XLZ8_9ACTN
MAATALTPLAPGTKVFTVGTFYEAEIVTSEIVPGRFNKGPVRKSVIRWTVDVPAAGIRKGEEQVWVHIPGRTPRFVVGATN